MRVVGDRMRTALLANVLAGMLVLLAQPALAQSAGGFRLPPGPGSTATPRVQGPVDPDNPVITPRPTPRPSPSPVPPPVATTAAPTPSATATTPRPTRAAPRPDSAAPGQPRAVPPGTPTPQLQPGQPAPGPAPTTPPTNAPIFSTAPAKGAAPALVPAAETGLPGWVLPVGAGLFALLLAIFGLVRWRHRREEAPIEVEFERPIVPAAQPEARPVPLTLPEPQLSKSAPALPVAASQAVEQDGIAIELEVRRMSASLMATTLSYRLTLSNTGKEALNALAIEGDMIAAQADQPTERQVAARDQALALRHALVELAPGESAEFTGDIRLPLTEIVPIRSGTAAYFIPLARFRVAAGAKVLAQTFVVGETPDDPAAALRPFRLDLGPRTYSKIGQRAV